MCPPGCREVIARKLSRRGLARIAGGAGAAAAMAPLVARPARAQAAGFARIVDLTHPLSAEFPTYFGVPGFALEQAFRFAEAGFNLNNWTLNEHTGTHMDAPIHFSADGQTNEAIPVERLVAPLAVIDIRAKAADDADAQLTPDDVKAWEAANGPLPAGACVAMLSGWDAHARSERFRNVDAEGKMHFPGFHVEAAQLLIEEHEVVGLAVDTLSLDHGPSADFATHYAWLPTNRWGLECVAGLGELPPAGATLIAGALKVVGGTGGPSRVLALV